MASQSIMPWMLACDEERERKTYNSIDIDYLDTRGSCGTADGV